ncbi:MAG: dephospho-CoA kinase [Solirubrobacterales bacterium]
MTAGRPRPPFVGLTGTIASGKSAALAELEKLGAATLSADQVVHEIYEDPEVIGLVAERLGSGVVKDRAVDREAVAAEVFADPAARAWLEQLVWPRVGKRILDFRAAGDAADPQPRVIVVEVPLLFESGIDQAFDKTVAITVDEATRKRRAEARGTGISELGARDARQMSAAEKAQRADYVIENDGSLEDLAEQLSLMLDVFDVIDAR